MPRWQVAVFCAIVATLLLIIAADVLGYAPRHKTRAEESFARLEASVVEIRADQESTRAAILVEQARLRAENEQLRNEMRTGFAEIRKLLEKQPSDGRPFKESGP
jgi:hypothetical protein